MQRYPLYIFDLDGTLYRGDLPIEEASKSLGKLRAEGSGIRFLTNNSSQTREFFLAKLLGLGIEAKIEEIYTTALGSAKYLLSQGLQSVFAVGEAGLVSTLRSEGLTVANSGNDGITDCQGGESDSVLVGLCKHFNYNFMNAAMQRIRAGQRFVATNPDTTYPMEHGRLIPGAGSIVAGIQACSEVVPYVVGKPNPYLIQVILQEAGIPAQQALVVGDRLDTDIESGLRAGCPTHLVLSGVTSVVPTGQQFSPDLGGLL